MKWLISFVCLLIMATSLSPISLAEEHSLKVAFVRENDLWIKVGNREEKRITSGEYVRNPEWSYDGNWLAFTKGKNEKELCIFQLSTNEMTEIYSSVQQFQWSPKQLKIAFLANGVLNITDASKMKETTFENVALGVGNFSWKPDGKEFLVSSQANLVPKGWTSVELYTVAVDANLNQEKIKHFFTLPEQSKDFFAVMTSPFKWSSDGKWISFLGIPTASISMDMNTLCVLSDDGKIFQQLGEMLFFDDWFRWAPRSNRLAFIEGEGRFAVKNKHLVINEFPVQQGISLTPSGFVEKGFTWVDGVKIVVSRATESEWSNNPKERPRPQLYHINILTNQQYEITAPKKDEGDYMPIFLPNSKKLAWVRADKENIGTIYIGDQEGKQKDVLIKNIGDGTLYEDSYGWSKIISYYD